MKKGILLLALVVAMISGFASIALADASHPATFVKDGQNVYLQLDANGKPVPIHSGYTVNTDACASCHSVHNAKDQDRMLLQWTSPSEACMACHDGTVTAAYDVEHGKVLDTNGLTNGGLFATMAATAGSASQHDVESSVTLSANSIPGGKTGAAGIDGWGSWDGSEFECTSCHEPHGNGGNARLLNPNPNGAMKKIEKAQLNLANGVYKFSGVTTSSTAGVTTIYVVSSDDTAKVTGNADAAYLTGKKLPMMTPKFFDATGKDISTKVTVLPTNDGKGNPDSKDAIVTWADASAAPAAIFTDYTPVLQVEMTFLNGSKYTTNETIKYGVGMQEFCAACHTDYFGSRGNNRAYNTSNQHHNGAISRDGYKELGNQNGSTGSCLTCHYAHGVDESRWAATTTVNNKTPWAGQSENAGSSALKRLPNMGTCEVCHAWEAKSYNTTNGLILQKTGTSLRYQTK